MGGQVDYDNPTRPTLQLAHNGDPYGRGFVASEHDGKVGWFYRGDIGAMPRSWWRSYAARNGYALREREV